MRRCLRTISIAYALAVVCVMSACTAPVQAQNIYAQTGAQSLLIDPSVRASGMGKASNAVFWGQAPNDWSNPALLSYRAGVRYEWGKTQLIPDLADDVYFTTKRVTIGYWGLGLLLAGRPVDGLGGLKLDYGRSIATDPDGNFIGEFSSSEEIGTLGVSASLAEFTEHLLGAAGRRTPPLARFGDVSVGWAEKKTEVSLAPAWATVSLRAAEGRVTTHDSGILVRLTPYNAIDYPGYLPGLERNVRIRLDASYGGSTQNYDDATIAYIDLDQADPIARIQTKGWSVHAAVALPSRVEKSFRSKRLGWLYDVIDPLVSWGKAGDRSIPMVLDPSTGGHLTGTRIETSGWELTLANIYSIRRGRIDDPAGTILGKTRGWGVAIRLRDLAGISYDYATVPQSIYLGTSVKRRQTSVSLNPLGIWRTFAGKSETGTLAEEDVDEGEDESDEDDADLDRSPSRRAVTLSVFGQVQQYGMKDVNEFARNGIPAFPNARGEEIEGGAGFGSALRLWPSQSVFVSLELQRLLASTSGTGQYLGATYAIDLEVPATGIGVGVGYILRPSSRLRWGLCLSPGYYMTTGEIEASGPGIQEALDLEGSGFGVQGLGLASVSVAKGLQVELGAGYRYARTTDVTVNGGRVRNADGSLTQIDWSGVTARAGLTFTITPK